MVKNFDDLQKLGKDGMDTAMRSFGAWSKGVQSIAVEFADYTKRSFDESSAVAEKLLGAKSIDKAIELQTEYAKSAYEGFVEQAAKVGELYADVAKETYKPFEHYFGKATPAK